MSNIPDTNASGFNVDSWDAGRSSTIGLRESSRSRGTVPTARDAANAVCSNELGTPARGPTGALTGLASSARASAIVSVVESCASIVAHRTFGTARE